VLAAMLLDPFRGMSAWRNPAETQKSGHAPRSGTEIKDGRSSQSEHAGEAVMRDNSEGGELDPAIHGRRRCKNNSPSVLS